MEIQKIRHLAQSHSIQSIVMLSVINAECPKSALYTECRYAERHYAECLGTKFIIKFVCRVDFSSIR